MMRNTKSPPLFRHSWDVMLVVPLALILMTTACKKVKISEIDSNPTEECISFAPSELALHSDSNDVYRLQYGAEVIDFFPNIEEGTKTLETIQYYRFNKKCRCGSGSLTNNQGEELDARMMEYWLKDHHGMTGETKDEDCISFNPDRLIARKLGKNWTIVERPGHLMFSFGNSKYDCINALKVIKKYGFTESCFIGRRLPSMQYLKGGTIEPQEDPQVVPVTVPTSGPIFTKKDT